jgi:hypothetical protein
MAFLNFAPGAALAAALFTLSIADNALAAGKDYSFEVVKAAPAGPHLTDVTIKLIHVSDGKPVPGALISGLQDPANTRERGPLPVGRVAPRPLSTAG